MRIPERLTRLDGMPLSLETYDCPVIAGELTIRVHGQPCTELELLHALRALHMEQHRRRNEPK